MACKRRLVVTAPELFDWVKNGGAYCSPLLLLALIWMNVERLRLLEELRKSEDRLGMLSERTLIVLAELKTLLFSDRKAR